jgi:hypothetical protein
MQQSHSREHDHPKPDFALIGDTFVQYHQNSSSKYTIVDTCWDVGTSQNCKKKKKKSPGSQDSDEQFSFFLKKTNKQIGKSWQSKIHFRKGNLQQKILVCAELSPK